MPSTGSEYISVSRVEVVRQLEWLRRQGVAGAQQLLILVTADNYAEIWPYLAPLFDEAMRIQQRGARTMLSGYLIGSAISSGIPIDPRSAPSVNRYSSYRDGTLPSGMPWARLVYSLPTAIDHRIENGMTPAQAVARTKMMLFGAINSQTHAEFRRTTRDLLDAAAARYGTTPVDRIPTGKVELRPGDLVTRGDGFTVVVPERDLEAEEFLPSWDPLEAATPVRWIRQPSPGACPWCILQASRGAVFYTQQTAVAVGHTNCRCVTFPEPRPGAYANTILYDPAEIKKKTWRNHRGVEQDVSLFGARTMTVRKDLRLEKSGLGLAS